MICPSGKWHNENKFEKMKLVKDFKNEEDESENELSHYSHLKIKMHLLHHLSMIKTHKNIIIELKNKHKKKI